MTSIIHKKWCHKFGFFNCNQEKKKKKKIALLELVCAFMFKNKDFWKDQVMPLLVSELAHLIKRQDVFSHRCHVTISPILCFQQMPCLFILSLQTLA